MNNNMLNGPPLPGASNVDANYMPAVLNAINDNNGPPAKKKRSSFTSCSACQSKHCACDEQRPCSRCIRLKIACVEGVPRKNKAFRKIAQQPQAQPQAQLQPQQFQQTQFQFQSQTQTQPQPQPQQYPYVPQYQANTTTLRDNYYSELELLAGKSPSKFLSPPSSATSQDSLSRSNLNNDNINNNNPTSALSSPSPFDLLSFVSGSGDISPDASLLLFSDTINVPSSLSSLSPSPSPVSTPSPPSLSSTSTLNNSSASTFFNSSISSSFSPSTFTSNKDNGENYDIGDVNNIGNILNATNNDNNNDNDSSYNIPASKIPTNMGFGIVKNNNNSNNTNSSSNNNNNNMVSQLQGELSFLRHELAAARYREKLAFPLQQRVNPKEWAMSLWSLKNGLLLDYSVGFMKLMKFTPTSIDSLSYYEISPPALRAQRRHLHQFIIKERPDINCVLSYKEFLDGEGRTAEVMCRLSIIYFAEEVLLQLMLFSC